MIARNIQALRARDSLTQEALAERLGVSRQTVAKWESGEAVPDLGNAQALSRLFKVRLADLASHSEERAGYPVPPARPSSSPSYSRKARCRP